MAGWTEMIAQISHATKDMRRWLLLERNWWKVIFLLWFILTTSPFILRSMAALLPGSLWYELHKVEITDEFTPEGGRILNIDREIHQVFEGAWTTTEELLGESGGFTTVRRCVGTATYRPDKELPEPVTLEWWIGLKTENQIEDGAKQNCIYMWPWSMRGFDARTGEVPGGVYRLCTSITVQSKYGNKFVRRCSDV